MGALDALVKEAQQAQRKGRALQAMRVYRRVLGEQAGHIEARQWMGVALYQLGQYTRALCHLRQAAEAAGDHPTYANNLGLVYIALGEFDLADAAFTRTQQLRPGDRVAVRNLKVIAQRRDKLHRALLQFRSTTPGMLSETEAYLRLGVQCRQRGQIEQAVACYRRALQLAPDSALGYNRLGNVLKDQGRLDEAEQCFYEALRINPHYHQAMHNLGTAYGMMNRAEEADEWYSRALQYDADYGLSQFGRAHVQLVSGQFGTGWQQYEWRWQLDQFKVPEYRQPMWDGTPLSGRTLLLRFEQGLGDTMQFIRYAPMVKQRVGRVVFVCQERLLPLIQGASDLGIDAVIRADGDLPEFDVWVSLLSLPRLMGTTVESTPRDIPYLAADTELINQWATRLPAGDFRVGINWSGNPKNHDNHYRSFPLFDASPLMEIAGVTLISLQKGGAARQREAMVHAFDVHDLGPDFDEGERAFMDTAAVMQHLDLVITCDTSIGHLAGALGVPVWLAHVPGLDWRWLHGRTDTPWYPTMRVFPQSRFGHWENVFDAMAAELKDVLAGQATLSDRRNRD